MSHRYVACGLAVCTILIATPAGFTPHRIEAAETRRALLIGINKYMPGPAASSDRGPDREVEDLEGAINDVEAMKAVLVARYGFKPENVHVLRDTAATRDRILNETRAWLVRAASPGDVSLFYYAGHGSQVRNSRSRELDKLDETIVPTDVNLGRPDVRDKELARLFNEALEKNIVLTAIFDSCHSGSVARGLQRHTTTRYVEPSTRDVADPATPVPPETRGALIMSAAQDLEKAMEVRVPDEDDAVHGLFSWALVKTLRTMPVNESAERVFLRVRAMMQSVLSQEPVLAASEARRRATLFGATRSASPGVVVALQSIEPDGSVILQGGLAAGVRRGAELVLAEGARRPTMRVIEERGVAQSRAEVMSGSINALKPGALFEVTKWAAAPIQALRVWIRPSRITTTEVRALAGSLTALTSDPGITWIDDPTGSNEPFSLLQNTDGGWQITGRDGAPKAIGAATPTSSIVMPHLITPSSGSPHVMADLPLPIEASSALRAGTGAAGPFAMSATYEQADYVLLGRVKNGVPEYAWVRPSTTAADAELSAVPVLTEWVQLGADPAQLASQLRKFAIRLSVIRNWLHLESPADTGTFPYRLALKHARSGELKTGGVAENGDAYGIVLTRDDAALTSSIERRYVYVFAVNSTSGEATLLFPRASDGNVENLLPLSVDNVRALPIEIRLGPRERFEFEPGVATFLLLTTATALPDPTVLEGAAVRSIAIGPRDPLTQLLLQGGTGRRDVTITTPTDWSIERLTIRTPGTPRRP